MVSGERRVYGMPGGTHYERFSDNRDTGWKIVIQPQ
jgi:hypothetical protein